MKILFHAILLIIINNIIVESFQCFSDPKVIKYQNAEETVVDNLPQVRVMMCGYSSQCALNMVAYLFMKEKLGMDVSFYPTDDYANVWSGDLWDNWANNAYPRNYFRWLAEDYMDLNFEFWPTQLVKTAYDGTMVFDGKTEYVLSGLIDFGGFVGAYGEESIWLPKYWVNANPKHIIPEEIATDTIFRQQIIDASSNQGVYNSVGGTDYIHLYNTTGIYNRTVREISCNCTNSTIIDGMIPFDRPNYIKPTVWGSSPGYFMSEYANDLIQNAIPGGLDLNFVTTGGEGSLMTLVKDLYTKRAPFLANIYTIDDNFGVVANTTSGELQQFEKVAFARNPDQSAYDPCFLAKKCQYHIGPIMKAANPRLKSRYPEAFDFFAGFTMGTRQLNKVVSNYLEINSTGMSATDHWLEAACEWLKSDDEAAISTWNISAWNVNVKRYDCLDGCGFSYTDSETENIIASNIGGQCDYYTGQCVCDRDQLFSDKNCQESCPGLIGPLLNASGNGYSFEWCSGHGECDTVTRQCQCHLSYGDSACSTPYEQYNLSIGLQVIIVLFSAILSIVCILCMIWLRINKAYKTVKALSVDMTTIMTFGLLMITLSNIAATQAVNSISCIAWQWLFGLGGILAIMSPLLKAYRVSRVFHGGKMLRAVKITDKMLMSMLIKCAVIEILICCGYGVLHELFGGKILYYNHEKLRIENQCNQNSLTNYISMGSYAYFFIMLCALTKYSYGTRRALSVFKESTCAYFSSFLSLLCTLIVLVFSMATDDPTFLVATQSFAVILVVGAVLTLFYGTRIYAFYTEPENRNVTDRSATSTTSTANTGFSNSVMKQQPQK